jgi:hypothetical protein
MTDRDEDADGGFVVCGEPTLTWSSYVYMLNLTG